jgi:hypothetical protein
LDSSPIPKTPHCDRRGSGHFKNGWNDTLDVLEKELNHLGAKDIVIQIETTLDDIRNDGWPRSDARVSGPKVAISFRSKYGQLTYRCDDCSQWIHNVRCIALTLQRLRMAELYGVTKRGEQYTGFKALPSGIPMGTAPDTMTSDEALSCIASAWGSTTGSVCKATLQDAYRVCAMKLHPDRPNGSQVAFQRLTRAYETLKRHWGMA